MSFKSCYSYRPRDINSPSDTPVPAKSKANKMQSYLTT